MTTSFGPITLYLPSDADAQITASTEHGKIKSDFPSLYQNADTEDIFIKLGKGTTVIQLETNDDILLKKQ